MINKLITSALDALVDHVVILETDGSIIYANKAWKQFAESNGSPQGTDYVGTNYLDVCRTSTGIDSDDALVTSENIYQIIKGNIDQFYLEYPCHSPTKKRWFGMRATAIEGDAPHKIVIIHSNITERVLAEQKLQTKHGQITSILKSVKDAIWSFTLPDNNIIYPSPSFEKMYECYASEFQLHYKKIIAPDDLPAFEDAMQQIQTNHFADVEYSMTHIDGTKHRIHQHMYVARDTRYSSTRRIDAISRDITNLKLIEKQTLQLQLQKERVEMLQNFVRDVSHDFRTPMTIINMNIDLLSRDNSTQSIDKRLPIMQKQIRRLEKLLDQMILQSKLDANHNEQFEFGSIDLDVILRKAYQTFSETAEENNVQFEFTMTDDSLLTYGCKEYLSKAIENILENAILYTSKGSIHLNIELLENFINIRIEDTGSGIAASDLPQIFDRFFRVDKARSVETGGAGLGLTIAKSIIDMHGGKIHIESTLGEGTLVTIKLPASKKPIQLS